MTLRREIVYRRHRAEPEQNTMLWTLDDAAAFLRLSRRTVYRMVLDGRLPGHKIGGHWRLFKPEIMEALKLNDLRG